MIKVQTSLLLNEIDLIEEQMTHSDENTSAPTFGGKKLTYNDLTCILSETAKALTSQNKKQSAARLQIYANKLHGKHPTLYKILRALLITLGAILIVGGALIATATALPSFGLGTIGGAALAASGVAAFSIGVVMCKDPKRMGLSNNLDQLSRQLLSA